MANLYRRIAVDTLILVIFALVYLGMILGELPGFALDRTGVALLGAIAVVAFGDTTLSHAWSAVDMPTLYLLFGMMVVSAQFRLAGFYTYVTRWLVGLEISPTVLLGLVVGVVGLLSAILTNDIVCLAMAPMLIEGCARRRLDPVPYLLALACASNVGSAATLIGNPQNILIGQALKLSFPGFLFMAGIPALLGLLITWAVIAYQFRDRWTHESTPPHIDAPAFDAWQSFKALALTLMLMFAFLFVPKLPREGVALVCAGLVLMSRRMASRDMLALVDWQLLVLFIALFIVNDAFLGTHMMSSVIEMLRTGGMDPNQPAVLFGLSAVLSNLVSNVPATMLLLPTVTHPLAGPILALSSTFAGNLIIVGSIANIIVVTSARSLGVAINFRTHARTGIPITLLTLAVAALWLGFCSSF